jgi:hypothetical protein
MGGFQKGAVESAPGSKSEKTILFGGPGGLKLQQKTDDVLIAERPEKIPPPKPIAPRPTVDEDQVTASAARKRKRGRQSTFLTGDLVPQQTKKTTLG